MKQTQKQEQLARCSVTCPRIIVIYIHRQNRQIFLNTQACMMQQVQGLVNLFYSLSTLAMSNRKYFKRVKKTCMQFLLVLWSPLQSLCLSLRCVQGELGGCDWMVAQSTHRGYKTRQTELRSRTLLFLRTLLLTDIHITGAQQAPLKCRAYVMANPNWLRSPDCSRAIQCMWVYVQSVCVWDTYFPLPLRQQ